VRVLKRNELKSAFAKPHMQFVFSKNCRDYAVHADDFIPQYSNAVVGLGGLITLFDLCGVISHMVFPAPC
jgi:hypothetical protein